MGKVHDALRKAEEERARRGQPAEADPSLATRALSGPDPQARRRATQRTRAFLAAVEAGVSEEYRTLRARIQSIRRERPIRTLIVTSALADEGKTTTALNLALSFGLEREGRTCLVDADLRTPAVHDALPAEAEVGLAELLEFDAKLDDALIRVPDTRLWVLTVKRPPVRPSELLASVRMAGLLNELQGRFDTVIVDSPPVLGLPDATTLVDLCDAVLLVVGNGISTREDIDDAMTRIDARKAIGVVFNRSREKPRSYGSKYGGSSS